MKGNSLAPTATSRVFWVDIAKAAAMFAIVLGHALRGGEVYKYLYSFHVPLFFILSGLVSRRSPLPKYTSFLKKRAYTLLLPYFIFGALSIVIYAVLGRFASGALGLDAGENPSVFQNLLGLVYANGKTGLLKYNLPLWFLPCIFIMQNLYYAFAKLTVKLAEKPAWDIGAHCLAMLAVGAAGQLYIRFFKDYPLPFGFETACTLFPFFILGALVRKKSTLFTQGQQKRKRIFLFSLLALGAGFILSLFNKPVDYVSDTYHNLLLFYGAATCSSIGYIMLCKVIHRCRPLEYLGIRTMSVLVMHKFPLLLFQTAISFTAVRLRVHEPLTAVLVSTIAILLCLVADLVLSRFCPVFLGNPLRKHPVQTKNAA